MNPLFINTVWGPPHSSCSKPSPAPVKMTGLNIQTMKWPGFWWDGIILFELCTASAWWVSPWSISRTNTCKGLGLSGLCGVHRPGTNAQVSHYEPGGFLRIWTSSAFPPSLWHHAVMLHGIDGKLCVETYKIYTRGRITSSMIWSMICCMCVFSQ